MPYVINTAAAKGGRNILDVIAAGRETWRTDTLKTARSDVVWCVTEDDQYEICEKLKASQRMSRIPGMRRLCDKSAFAELMAAHEECAQYFPRTHIVTPEGHSIPKAAWKRPMIFKPNEGAAGEGIYLLFSEKDLNRRMELCKAESAIVQEYVDHPMLIDGVKWDLRVYVLVLSLDPLRIFLCQEGLARFASEKYAPATSRTAHHIASHLTNYSISKYAQEFVHSDDPMNGESGNKRTLSSVFGYLERCGCDVGSMWESIRHIATTSCEVMAAELLGDRSIEAEIWPARDGNWERVGFAGSEELPGKHTARNGFHVLGFDVMFDAKGHAWLLEVNCSPSLAIDSVFPQTGSAAEDPVPPEEGMPHTELMHRALQVMGSKTTKICKCMSHHRPHIHYPCAIDLVAKRGAIEGALLMVKRDMKARKDGQEKSCEELAEGTMFEHCPLVLGIVEGE